MDDLTAGAAHPGIVLKIDVDGPELAVRNGSRRTLAEPIARSLSRRRCSIRSDRGTARSSSSLASFAYECFDILEPIYRTSDAALWQVDLLFVKRGSALRSVRRYE